MRKWMLWDIIWARAGSVPLRQKIVGIIVIPLLLLGSTIAWWVNNQLAGWLSYLLSEARVAQAISIGIRSVSIITLFAAIAGLGIGWFLTWFLTRPILDMTHVARRIKDGDLSVRAPVWANDEIGELGRAFNDMIASLDKSHRELECSNEQLRNRNRDLAVLYQLADMANKSYTVQQVSEHGLQQTLENTSASAGFILLQDEQRSTISASSNLPASFLDSALHSLSNIDFIYNGITQNSDPLVIKDIDISNAAVPASLILESQKLQCRTLVLAPILGNQEILGILVMIYLDAAPITLQHLQLISGICNQLGVTIQNSQLWEELRYKEQLRTQLLHKLVSAQEDERQRISRELHDETGQSLTSLLIQLKILERCATLEDLQSQVAGIRQLTVQTLQEVRRLAADLRPAALDDLGLISALESYIYDYSDKSDISVDFRPYNMEGIRLPHDMEIVLYRVIQESLTNIMRHASASHVFVEIEREQEYICVSVVDDGCGFNTADVLIGKDCGLGLLGMQERIVLVGGDFRLNSIPGHGTRVEVQIKLPKGVVG
jgi:signal transduction histidine kinase